MEDVKEYKRKYERLSTPFLLRILTYNHKRLDSDHSTCAIGVNLSPGGLSFKYPNVIGEGDHLKILIQDIGGLRREEIMANLKVVWTEDKDILSKRFGGKFVKLAPDKKIRIMQLIRRNERERIRNIQS